MKYYNKLYRAAMIAISLVIVSPAQAILLNTGESVVYNFDGTGVLTPPWFDVEAIFSFADGVPGDLATYEWFDGLNTTGANFATAPTQFVSFFPTIFLLGSFPDALDGIFSVEVTAVQGPFEITIVQGDAFLPDGPGTIFDATIPEPATLALLVLGLAGLDFSRRRKRT